MSLIDLFSSGIISAALPILLLVLYARGRRCAKPSTKQLTKPITGTLLRLRHEHVKRLGAALTQKQIDKL